MFIVEIIGGLGNQMFQYAFYLALKNFYGNETKLYLGRFNETDDNQGFELSAIFGIKEPEAAKEEICPLIDDSLLIKDRIRRKLFGTKSTYRIERVFRYNPSFFKMEKSKTIYLRGLWQDELYFRNFRKEILEKFSFPTELDPINQEILKNIQNSSSVSIHVRRGDYLSNKKYRHILGNICTYEYYKKAVTAIKLEEKDPTFFIFSNDIEWTRRNLNFLSNDKVIYIDHNKELQSYIDMQLMSNCKHNIIANSSFSWWGAWLNTNPNKIVMAPKKWFKNNKRLEANNIVPIAWRQIQN